MVYSFVSLLIAIYLLLFGISNSTRCNCKSGLIFWKIRTVKKERAKMNIFIVDWCFNNFWRCQLTKVDSYLFSSSGCQSNDIFHKTNAIYQVYIPVIYLGNSSFSSTFPQANSSCRGMSQYVSANWFLRVSLKAENKNKVYFR